MKKNEKGFSALELILVIVVVLAIGGLGWYAWKNKSKDNTSNETASVSKQNTDTNVTSSTDKTKAIPAGYKKYDNATNKYSFVYPEAWTASTPANLDVQVAPAGKEFPNIYVWATTPDNSSCEQTKQSVTTLSVNGIESKQFEGGTQTSQITTCVPKDGKVFHIVHSFTTEDFKAEYKVLLESFSFK